VKAKSAAVEETSSQYLTERHNMINWLVNRIFRWDPLREAIFDEVRLYQSVDRSMWEYERENPSNLTWSEGNRWYGWTYNSQLKRYYFDDIGNESLMGLWEDQWLREDK
jgi:hypothetical protein